MAEDQDFANGMSASDREVPLEMSASDREVPLEMSASDRELLGTLEEEFRPLPGRKPSTTIFQVPKTIFPAKQKLYNPRLLFLGLNWDAADVHASSTSSTSSRREQQHIKAHMRSILHLNPKNKFEDYLRAMKEMSEDIKECYSVELTMNFRDLIALVLSCGHILHTFLLSFDGKLKPEVDHFCSSRLQTIWVDFLLVKNQVPFLALQKIYDMLKLEPKYPCLVDLCLRFFEKFLVIHRRTPEMKSKDIHHLLHLVHCHLLPSNDPPKPPGSMQLLFTKLKSFILSSPAPGLPTSASPPHVQQLTFLSARSLKEAGIKFRKKKTAGFSNITVDGGVLEIPILHIDDNTEVLLRNLTAWEQSHLSVGSYFSSYSIFMGYIINAAEDVQILNKKGIIEQTLGSEARVASIFNGLNTNIVYNGDGRDFLPQLRNDLNWYCDDRIFKWKAILMTDYLGNPWLIISVAVAIYLLVVNSVRTF